MNFSDHQIGIYAQGMFTDQRPQITSWLFSRISHYRLLCCFINSVLRIGSSTAFIDQAIDTTFFNKFLIPIKCIA